MHDHFRRKLFRISVLLAAFIAATVAVAPPAQAQSQWFSTGPHLISGGVAGFSAAKPVTGKPYIADQVTEQSQTLADGTHIERTNSKIKLFRDSQGRTRVEHFFVLPNHPEAAETPHMIQISDPAAQVSYILYPQTRSATKVEMAPRLSPSVPAGSMAVGGAASRVATQSTVVTAQKRGRPQMQHEDLGTQVIDGVEAQGTRYTFTHPVGSEGNDREFTTVTETWHSPDYGLLVLSKTSDPRSGEQTTRLTSFSPTEPDPGLFEVPEGYTVQEQGQH